MIHLPETRPSPDWELIRLLDGSWSVRFKGTEQWILTPARISREDAYNFQKMLNSLGLPAFQAESET